MQYYASEKDAQAMDELVRLAQQIEGRAVGARACAHEAAVLPPGTARDSAQADYDSHLTWVRKLVEDLHAAAKNLP
jgi:hypothetical protein